MLSMFLFFFFNDTATTEIYTLSLHDALPIWAILIARQPLFPPESGTGISYTGMTRQPGDPRSMIFISLVSFVDRKSTRLNSSHGYISYAVFCLKKKKTTIDSAKLIRLPSSQT